MKNISYNISSFLWQHNIISEQETDVCRYGLEIFISSLVQVVSIIIVSVFMNNFFQTCIFFAVFIPLRMYAGGYHAKTKLRCYAVSVLVYITFTIMINIIPSSTYNSIIFISSVFSVFIVYLFAPIVHINKHVNSIEIQNYKRIALIICIFESLFCLVLNFVLYNKTYVISIAFGQLAAIMAMLAAIIKNLFIQNE